MFKSHLHAALRFIKNNKIFVTINTLGLSIALAVSFLILVYVINEFSYNHCHKNRRQIYRVLNYYEQFGKNMGQTPYVLTSTIKNEIPQAEMVINTFRMRDFRIKLNDDFIQVKYALSTQSDVFNVFTIRVDDNAKSNGILDDPDAMVLSRDLADKLFPREDPVGKEVMCLVNGTEVLFNVKAVFDDLPENSSLRADCFINTNWGLNTTNTIFETTNPETDWSQDWWITWVMLTRTTDISQAGKLLDEIEKKASTQGIVHNYSLQNLSDVYLRSDNIGNGLPRGNLRNVRLFAGIALLIILVAVINYIVLSTAVSTGRAKEIGIRKIGGADNIIVRKQLMTESVLLTMLTLPIAFILMWSALPVAERLFQTSLHILSSNLFLYIASGIGIVLLSGIASGVYTSAYLSRININDILKNSIFTGKRRDHLRSVLIVIQLIIFCSFVSATLIIRSQYLYSLNFDPGYASENIILIELPDGFDGYQTYLNSIKSNINVVNASGSSTGIPTRNYGANLFHNYMDKDKRVSLEALSVDYDFIETMEIEIAQGRSFSREFGGDIHVNVILNEAAVKELSITDPIGKDLSGMNIIGVVKGFNIHPVNSPIPPFYMSLTDEHIHQAVIKFRPGSLTSLLPFLKTEWEKVAMDKPFNYITIENLIKDVYTSERNLNSIITLAAVFTLLIASIGLFGLTLFIARTRTKEIGIKKVFGSTEKAIVFSFIFTNIYLVTISALLSVPVTWFFMSKWLNNYVYKTEIKWWVFLISFIIAMAVVVTTASVHAIKASRTNPAESLRNS